jgi:HD superfamily phosphohydrolase
VPQNSNLPNGRQLGIYGGMTDSGHPVFHNFTLPNVFRDTEIIADPLNRLIAISKFEKRIICCPEFQRLRRIKQLGFAHFVYPAAEYSRFTHSIGVCHQAKRIVDTINKNLENEPRYQKWRVHGHEVEEPIDPYSVLITPFERVIVAAAGLLHDLPHGPFSHEIEGILTDEGETLIPDHDKLADNPALFLYLFDKDVSEIALILEYFSKEFFASLFREFTKIVPSPDEAESNQYSNWRQSLAALWSKSVLTETGMVKVGPDSPASPLQFAEKDGKLTPPDPKFHELPFLAVAIFEVLLFEKQNEWLSPNEKRQLLHPKGKNIKTSKNEHWGVTVKTDWANDAGIRWQPIPGWFRAYRKDIIGNTICADLIDYVNRDGYHTGIVSTIDLKFLDRMMIVRALLPQAGSDGQRIPKPPANTISYEDIPISCEHVVFDIYDHKRGFIRQSVLTEILAYLQARYLLCERVYNHRVVEAARSMLQRIILILGRINKADGAKLLSVSHLHPLNRLGPGDPLAPIGDDAFLNWVRSLPQIQPDVYRQHSSEIDDAIELATLLQERRVFREAIIYDGLHGFVLPGQLGGAEVSCRSLEAAFLTNRDIGARLEVCLRDIDQILTKGLQEKMRGVAENNQRLRPRIKCLIGVRKWGKRYKPPLVLVSRPLKDPEAEHGSFDVEPLLDCEDPANIKKQLDALKASYDTLWKVYLFLHPIFHGRHFIEEHKAVALRLEQFAAKNTGIRWKNAIIFKQLLTEPLDNVVFLAQPEKAYFENYLIPRNLSSLLQEMVRIAVNVFPKQASRFEETFNEDDFRLRITDELLKAKTEDRLKEIIARAPNLFRDLCKEKNKPEQLALAARAFEQDWQLRVIEAVLGALRGTTTGPQRDLVL